MIGLSPRGRLLGICDLSFSAVLKQIFLKEDNNNFISLEPSFETSGSNDQVRVDYT